MVQNIIEVRNLSKSFDISTKEPGLKGTIKHFFRRQTKSLKVIKNISFEIKEGEIVGFLVAYGAGKTTILKMLCGLIYPSEGSILVSGYLPFRRKENFLKNITLIMGQKQQLIWDLPPIESFYLNASIYDLDKFEAKKRIKKLSEMLEIDEELFIPVRKLSLGQRMKSELLAALIHEPNILFLDEPTLGLDINAQRNLRKFLQKYNKDTDEVWSTITTNQGSVSHLNFLTANEKDTFKTAFEIDQRWIVELGADRTPHISQAQSVNIFVPADIHKKELHNIHFQALKNV